MGWIIFNPNPASINRVGDCAVRAISKALNIDWEEAYLILCMNGYAMGDMPNSNVVIASVLRQNGFRITNIPSKCPDCLTVKEFCQEYPHGTFVLGTGSHVLCVIDGDYYDSWNSGDEIPNIIWEKVK